MPTKSTSNAVKVRLPEYLLLWLSDCAERDYRTVEQQIVFLLAGCMERHEPETKIPVEVKPTNAALADTSAKRVPVPVAAGPRFPVLAPPPAEVQTIKIMGDASNAMGPAFSISGSGRVFRAVQRRGRGGGDRAGPIAARRGHLRPASTALNLISIWAPIVISSAL